MAHSTNIGCHQSVQCLEQHQEKDDIDVWSSEELSDGKERTPTNDTIVYANNIKTGKLGKKNGEKIGN